MDLRKVLKDNNLKVNDLVEIFGISRASASALVNNRTKITIDHLETIAKHINKDLVISFKEEGTKEVDLFNDDGQKVCTVHVAIEKITNAR